MVRFDGVYLLKQLYWRKGLNEHTANHPIHEVVSYRFVRFLKDGTTMSFYTTQTPKKVFEKMRHQMLAMQKG
jgi:hypothetical protein